MPICHRGKYHTRIPRELNIDQKTNPLYMSAAASINPDQEYGPSKGCATDLSFLRQTLALQVITSDIGAHFASNKSSLSSLVLFIVRSRISSRKRKLSCTFVYFGSQATYPLLSPFTSFTTSSKLSKSRAVTASKPTSKSIRAHSRKA
jgi:hypothetical protein